MEIQGRRDQQQMGRLGTERHARKVVAEGGGERVGAPRIVSAVEHDQGPAPVARDHLESPGPADPRAPRPDGRVGHVPAGGGREDPRRADGQRGVGGLVEAGQRELDVGQRPGAAGPGPREADQMAAEIALDDLGPDVAPLDEEGDADGPAAGLDDVQGLGRLGRGEGDPTPDDRRWLRQSR